jgi:hypothetical protein
MTQHAPLQNFADHNTIALDIAKCTIEPKMCARPGSVSSNKGILIAQLQMGATWSAYTVMCLTSDGLICIVWLETGRTVFIDPETRVTVRELSIPVPAAQCDREASVITAMCPMPNGCIAIAGNWNDTVFVYDGTTGTAVASYASLLPIDNRWAHGISGISYDWNTNQLVASSHPYNHSVFFIEADGRVDAIRASTCSSVALCGTDRLVISGKRIVHVIDRSGAVLYNITLNPAIHCGDPTGLHGYDHSPGELQCDADGNILIELRHDQIGIYVFDRDGKFLREIGSYYDAAAFAVDQRGRLWVLDHHTSRLDVFE